MAHTQVKQEPHDLPRLPCVASVKLSGDQNGQSARARSARQKAF
uniref:Uncharacterized protein n=1 Tax=Anguilla anguilla TaxID=7936 RepID=A0A0E9QRX3_ANGAN